MILLVLTSGSHVPTHQAYLEPADGKAKEDRLRSTVRIRPCLYTVLNYPHCAGWPGWKASLARSKVADHVDHHRMFDR